MMIYFHFFLFLFFSSLTGLVVLVLQRGSNNSTGITSIIILSSVKSNYNAC